MARCIVFSRRETSELNSPAKFKKEYPCAATDILNSREIFPDELWLMILIQVRDYDHFMRVQRSSSHMASMLQELRVPALFPAVAKVLFKRLKVGDNPDKLSAFLKLRKVFSDWKCTVDSILQNKEHHQLFVGDQADTSKFIRNFERKGCDAFSRFHDMAKFLQFTIPGKVISEKPFLFRSIKFDLALMPDPIMLKMFIDTTLMFLNLHGHQVWYLQIQSLVTAPEKYIGFIVGLNQILHLVPNLKALSFVCNSPEATEAPAIHESLEGYLQKYPLPEFKSLEILDCNKLPVSVVSRLLKNNQETIRELDVQYQDNLEPIFPPNLSSLRICIAKNTMYKLELFAANCQITRLQLDASSLSGSNSLIDLFKSLETYYSKTLVELCVKMPASSNVIVPTELKMDKLKCFSLRLSDANYVPLDFLLSMRRTLEQVSVAWFGGPLEFRKPTTSKIGDILQVYNFRNELHNSPIWRLLPKLKMIRLVPDVATVPARFCSRDDWNAHTNTRKRWIASKGVLFHSGEFWY